MKLNFLFLMLFSAIMLVGCTKEGPIGPQGPAGSQGQQGQQGPQGVQGKNADVKRYEIPIQNSTFGTYNGHYYKYHTITDLAFNLHTSAVVAFVSERHADTNWNNAEWIALPLQHFSSASTNCFNSFTYSVVPNYTNRLQFSIRRSCGGAPYSPMTGTTRYRVFVIAGSGMQILDTIDVTDYYAVTEAFGYDD